MIEAALARLDGTWGKAIDDLEDLVSIPSISAEGFPPDELERSARVIAALLTEYGLQDVEVLRPEAGHPTVVGHRYCNGAGPQVLLYAHHDVQPHRR